MKKIKIGVSISMIWATRNIIHSGLLQKLNDMFDVCVFSRLPSPAIENFCKQRGIRFIVLPDVAKRKSKVYDRVYTYLNQIHKFRVGKISEKYKQRLLRRKLTYSKRIYLKVRDFFLSLASNKLIYGALINLERYLYFRCHDLSVLKTILVGEHLDYLLLTAPLQQESEEFHLMRVSEKLGILPISIILGFDNLTTKGRLAECKGYFLLWNKIMQEELQRFYPQIPYKNIFIVGSPQFDFYGQNSWGYTRETFCAKLGLNPNLPIVFYSADTETLAPYEHLLVEDLIKRAQCESEIQDLQFIIRLHPFDRRPERWQNLKNLPNVVITNPWSSEDNGSWGFISEEDINLLCGSLKHSICNFNISSTMALDAIFCDRPVIAPAYDVSDEKISDYIMGLYQRAHYLPITNSNAITLARTPEEAIKFICQVLKNSDHQRTSRAELSAKMLGVPVGQSTDAILKALMQITQYEKTNNQKPPRHR